MSNGESTTGGELDKDIKLRFRSFVEDYAFQTLGETADIVKTGQWNVRDSGQLSLYDQLHFEVLDEVPQSEGEEDLENEGQEPGSMMHVLTFKWQENAVLSVELCEGELKIYLGSSELPVDVPDVDLVVTDMMQKIERLAEEGKLHKDK